MLNLHEKRYKKLRLVPRTSFIADMKAICLVLCLALARLAAGHIFRPQYYPEMDSLIVQPVEYVDRAQVLYRQQYQNDQSQESQQTEERYEPRQSNSAEHDQQQMRQHPRDHKQHHQQQQRLYQHQQQQQQPQQQQQRQPQKQNQKQQLRQQQQQPQQQQQNQQQQQQQQEQQQQEQRYQQRVQPNHDSTSAESRSQETEVIRGYAMPMYADMQPVNSRLYKSQKAMQPAYGDAIAWRGIEIAASPRTAVNKEDIEKIFDEAYKTLKHVSEEDKMIFHQTIDQATKNVNQDALLNATQMLTKNQYPVETHTIKTEDGYLLTLFRIPRKEETLVQRPVVFLMHGLLGSADDWLLMGPGKSLAYLLADAGYDVWLGNARGNKYSRRHVSKHPAQSDFWQFSNDDIALQDLPAMINYALKTSNQPKLYYVGHSLGTTAFFALAASRPEYNDKIMMMFALSPMAYMSNVRSPLLRMIAPTSPFYERMHEQLGHGQFKPNKELVSTVGGAMCQREIGCKHVCSNVNFVMSGVNMENLEVEQIPVIMAHRPAGASTRQIKQLAQAVASREFTKYDFGAEINQRVYGENQPPKYDMKKVQTPVVLYYSEEDWLAHPRDVERLASELPHVTESYKVPRPHFGNMDFQFAKNAPQLVYDKLIKTIEQQNNQQNNVY